MEEGFLNKENQKKKKAKNWNKIFNILPINKNSTQAVNDMKSMTLVPINTSKIMKKSLALRLPFSS